MNSSWTRSFKGLRWGSSRTTLRGAVSEALGFVGAAGACATGFVTGEGDTLAGMVARDGAAAFVSDPFFAGDATTA
jgi:hypothetical protein